jgi:hypothetical protein
MNDDDRRAIEGLFARLVETGRRAPPREPEAKTFIAAELARLPGAWWRRRGRRPPRPRAESAGGGFLAGAPQTALGGAAGGTADDPATEDGDVDVDI